MAGRAIDERRITTSLNPRGHEAVKRLSKLSGVPRATLVRAFIDDLAPHLDQLCDVLESSDANEASVQLRAWIRGVKKEALALEFVTVPAGDQSEISERVTGTG